MNKQKLFSLLSILGVVFFVAMIFGYIHLFNSRGEVIEQKIEVPDDFSRHFSRVITKNRAVPMEKAGFLSPSGENIGWDAFEGEYLLVNFWASWCAPCVTELPSLEKLQQKMDGKGVRVIAVSIDMGRTHDEIKEYLYNRNLGEFAAFFDDKREVQRNIFMRGIPTSYLLDRKGNVMHIFEGDADWGSPESLAFFNSFAS